MGGRSTLTATAEQKEELRRMAKSRVRDDADRARAILLTLEGWTSGAIGAAFGVTEDSVRHWRQWFSERGVAALAGTTAPGPSGARSERAVEIAAELLSGPV